MNPETNEARTIEMLRRLGRARPPAAVEARIVRGALARMERRTAPRWHPAAWTVAAAAAAAIALAVIVPTAGEGPAVPAIAAGSTLAADAGPASFSLGNHRVAVAPAGRVLVERLQGRSADLRLQDGEATFEVEPLAAGEAFRVFTERATVEVVGTVFTVAEDGTCTRVAVERGKVRASGTDGAVRLLGAGEAARFCAGEVPAGVALPGEARVREAIRLLAQNRELERAADLLASYRAEFPDGVFEEEALFHLCRIEAQLGRTDQAARLADEFVARFPESARAGRIRQWCSPGQ
jgi:ferric-dicitrate binding protein FerR (iron transport regulator)